MFIRRILPAAMLLFVSACQTESAGPQWIGLPADLNLGLPQFRQLSNASPHVSAEAPRPATSAMLASMGDGGEPQLPPDYLEVLAQGWLMADPSQAEARFLPADRLVYGQALGTSIGSFYRNTVLLRVFRDGSQISERTEDETQSCNCSHWRNPWGRTASTTIAVAGSCGLAASAYAKHVARLDFTSVTGTVFNLLSDSDNASDHDVQPDCPVHDYGGGGPDGIEGDEWYICYWVDYYSVYGEFLFREDLGCELLSQV